MFHKKPKERKWSGTVDAAVSDRETANRALARRAASESMVLLKNERNVLPLRRGSKVALYGAGASKTVKGGIGSGDVNERDCISIYQGLKNAGFQITTEDWMQNYDRLYERKRAEWRDRILQKASGVGPYAFFEIYSTTPFRMPAGEQAARTDTDTVIYVLSRISGEGADRFDEPGDYRLSAEEAEQLGGICALYKKVIVVVNAGGLVDLSFLEQHEQICGLFQIVQPGMEGGNAFADLVTGEETPSGKLADTWAFRYEDYPNSSTFSHNNGNAGVEKYEEGIYVGYRYFDTFSIPARYCFGYGLSYTEFRITVQEIAIRKGTQSGPEIAVTLDVQNIGNTYGGKEVVQVYASCPFGRLEKEYRRLAAFGKTRWLNPGESQQMTLAFPVCQLASYDEAEPGWILEPGAYGIWVGNSLESSELRTLVSLDARTVLVKTRHICPLREPLEERAQPSGTGRARYEAWSRVADIPVIPLKADEILPQIAAYSQDSEKVSEDVRTLLDSLSTEQQMQLVMGDPGKGQGSALGSAGVSVPGSAGETSRCAEAQGLTTIVLADGPAGLRLNASYHVHNGEYTPLPFEASFEHGFFYEETQEPSGVRHYQYCTAIPVGALLAQSWDLELMERLGTLIGGEMQEFGITLWLAPGMNIHRNPLCGRNFEYYSEDPFLSGRMAAAITKGVQKVPGCGTTVKHFACNNQEDNRMASNSVVSERALREIYLKGFEIAVKSAQPMAIMTSYNMVNGVHSANNEDLCTVAARDEWGFRGIIMTDWTTTEQGEDCTAAGCIRAGNDLIMPGNVSDYENLKEALASGKLTQQELKQCVARIVSVILQSNRYEIAARYGEQF